MDTPHRQVLLLDDHPLFRVGLRSTLIGMGLPVEVHEAASVAGALALLAALPRFDLIVYDWVLNHGNQGNHSGGGGVKGLVALVQTAPDVPIVVVSASEDDAVRLAALALGAADFVPKASDPALIRDRLWHHLQHTRPWPADTSAAGPRRTGPVALTLRQREVLTLMSRGNANKVIAAELRIAETTVRAHVSDILRLLHASNRTEAVVLATRTGLV